VTDEERRRVEILVRATCACQSCKDGMAGILKDWAAGGSDATPQGS
jgi:hypothetical protein